VWCRVEADAWSGYADVSVGWLGLVVVPCCTAVWSILRQKTCSYHDKVDRRIEHCRSLRATLFGSPLAENGVSLSSIHVIPPRT
jgi:hypothetical protein